jgi:paraquat-inducible protein B
MSQKANPISIGLFFVVGLALGVAGLVVFSSRSMFHPQSKDILYFNASLKGLSPGAPVKFRGVTIGTVVDIMIRHNQASNDFAMPVVIALDKKLAQAKADDLLQLGKQSMLDERVHAGLRGRLDAESLVTGVLYIALDMVPDAPPPVFHQLKPEYHEIPTLPSDFEQLLANLKRLMGEVAQIDVRKLSDNLNGVLTRADTSLSQLNFPAINAGATNLLEAAYCVVTTPNLTNSFNALHQTLGQAQAVLTRVGERFDPLADSVTNTLFDAQKTLAEVRAGVRNISDLVGPDSALRPNLNRTLEQLGAAGGAVADLADFLERNPNALLAGKKPPKEQP